MAMLAYSPLANGLLTGKVDPERKFPEDDLRSQNPLFSRESRIRVREMLDSLRPVAEKYNFTQAQLMIAWTLVQAGITHVLVGARDANQAAENARAGSVLLEAGDVMRITEAAQTSVLVVDESAAAGSSDLGWHADLDSVCHHLATAPVTTVINVKHILGQISAKSRRFSPVEAT
jgi:diketogulonate reductase-like aldo/keto reductase